MLDSPERVCAGQAWFEYPATFVLFSKTSSVGPDFFNSSSRLRNTCSMVSRCVRLSGCSGGRPPSASTRQAGTALDSLWRHSPQPGHAVRPRRHAG